MGEAKAALGEAGWVERAESRVKTPEVRVHLCPTGMQESLETERAHPRILQKREREQDLGAGARRLERWSMEHGALEHGASTMLPSTAERVR